MRVELRFPNAPEGPTMVCVSESEEESKMLDKVFGVEVHSSGLIGVRRAECRLADGIGEHFVMISPKPIA